MCSNTGVMVENLHCVFADAHIDRLADQIIRNGILVDSISYKIISAHLRIQPDGRFIRRFRQRLQEFLFLFLESFVAVPRTLLEGLAVQFFQFFQYCLSGFGEGEELPVTQGSRNLCGDKLG